MIFAAGFETLSMHAFKSKHFFSALLLSATLFSACEDSFERKASSHNSQGSHNVGMDCMSCHQNGGEGEFSFGVAGTAYQKDTAVPYPNTSIELYTGVHGTGRLKYKLEGDAYGNFYTTKNIHFGDGLYAAISGNGTKTYMTDPITTGSCNACHGVSTGLLWAN
ncbi:MAG: hypothetical protein HYZ14_10860 [Bacteroidetes bacterium]|nr:hypothetical protein [Bacteroidota bacterium]